MSTRDTYPNTLPLRRAGRIGEHLARWWWPALVAVVWLTLLGYLAHGGLTDRELVTAGLAAVALVVLTVRRRRWGARDVARTLAEYVMVGLLVALLATGPDEPRQVEAPPAAAGQHQAGQHQRQRSRPHTTTTTQPPLVGIEADQGGQPPGLLDRAAAVWGWLRGMWHQADQQTREPAGGPAPPTTRPPRPGGSP
jgi:hypothetical protein